MLFYATKTEEPSHPQDMKRFFKAVAVRSGSSVTLTCTAMAPQGFLSSFGSYLQPYMINWFVNSSMIRVPNCDDKPHKMKTCSLTLFNIKPRDNGRYFCQAANGLGCTYKQLQLTVTGGKQLTIMSSRPSVTERCHVTLSFIKKIRGKKWKCNSVTKLTTLPIS